MAKKIRICQIITRMDWAGSADIVRLLCTHLDGAVYDITVVCGLTLHPTVRSAEFLRSLGDRFFFVSNLQRRIMPFKDLAAFATLYRFFRKGNFDIVHTHTAKAGALGRLAAFLAGVPIIIHTPHGHNFYGYFGPVMSSVVIGIERFLSCLTTYITAFTDLELEDYVRRSAAPAQKMRRLAQGLELERFSGVLAHRQTARQALGIDREDQVVGLIARLEPVKGPDHFVEAAGHIARQCAPVTFVVVGEGSMRRRLEQRAGELGLAGQFIFTGWREDTPDLLSAMDVLVLPSLNEAVGIVLLEAQTAGVPVVATRAGGIPEVVRDHETGLLVTPVRPDAIAEAVITLLRDEGLRERMSACAKEWLSGRFKVSDMVDQISALYIQARKGLCLLLLLAASLMNSPSLWAQEYIQVPLAMHIASRVSDGTSSIAEITSVASRHGFGAVIINDRDLARWEYGLWPLRKIIRKVVQDQSIFRYGITRYIEDLRSAALMHPEMVILGGTESSPFYYWEGNPFTGRLTMEDASVHLLVVGLDTPQDYERLAVIGNPAAQAFGFDQYHGDRGIAPYQRFIDYARTHGALVFWAHPETISTVAAGPVVIHTGDYSYDLLRAQRYTGFEIYYEGDRKVGAPGGIWDEVLMEYCAGRRQEPVWALAGSGYDKNSTVDEAIAGVRTVLLVRQLDAQEVLAAMRLGRMYAVKGSDSGKFILDTFIIRDPQGQMIRTYGEEFTGGGPVLIEISGHYLDGQETPVTIQLIRNGAIYKTFQDKTPFHIFVEEPGPDMQDKRSYYRVQIDSAHLSLATNPVFLRAKKP